MWNYEKQHNRRLNEKAECTVGTSAVQKLAFIEYFLCVLNNEDTEVEIKIDLNFFSCRDYCPGG